MANRRSPRQLRCQIQCAVSGGDRRRNIGLVISCTSLEVREDVGVLPLLCSESRRKRTEESNACHHN
jgi:hypothetical protein